MLAAVAVVCSIGGSNIVSHLIFKYLLKRRIAWVALAAVMLCTTMVLVVISVMGGWLNMFKQSFHGLTGDVIVKSESLEGFRVLRGDDPPHRAEQGRGGRGADHRDLWTFQRRQYPHGGS